MFPYLHKTTILSYLGNARHARLEELQPVKRCLINTCLAFASVHGAQDHHRKDDMQNAREYFEAARMTLPEVMSNKPDVETIQALLLVLQYSQGTQRSSETWGLMGAVVQRAFQIGLYQSTPLIGLTPLEMGIRTRTWWMVFMMDK
ncbi:hypothetical protein N7523_000114 [Penicillium sp. IBT 18751x]|nr:hypothetical protein N7523_000114 [Penicillium sp. IBT 18751x]